MTLVSIEAVACDDEVRSPMYSEGQSWMYPSFEDRKEFVLKVEKLQNCKDMDVVAPENHYFFYVLSAVQGMGEFASDEERYADQSMRIIYAARGGFAPAIRHLATSYRTGYPLHGVHKNIELYECLIEIVGEKFYPPFEVREDYKDAALLCLDAK